MAHIHVLPDSLVNQIAAGEVVERPVSVVKELVENSLDAGATRIDVAISQGGTRWISVSDNGTGMDQTDAELAFLPHATSKIRSFQDLERVETLGFRGEALPSIASIATVRLRTRTERARVGLEVHCNVSGEMEISSVSCPAGTRVEVADLFERVPVRRKFLKSPVTEAAQISRWLERMALVRSDVHFSLEREQKLQARFLPTDDLRERIMMVLPPSVGEHLLAFDQHGSVGRAHGFASPTDLSRGHGNDSHVFVNNRPVRDRLLSFAVRDAYRDALPPGRQPIVVLYLEVPHEQVDVNVHPTKSEVRFRDPDGVRRLIRDALGQAIAQRPAPSRSSISTRSPGAPSPDWVVGDSLVPADFGLAPAWIDLGRSPSDGPAGRGTSDHTTGDLLPPGTAVVAADPHARPLSGQHRPVFARQRYLGQVLRTYLVLEASDALVLVDQHAAHERVLFERLRRSVRAQKIERQMLLTPVWIELPGSTADRLEALVEPFEQAGFELELGGRGIRGGMRVGIKSVPSILGTTTAASCNWIALFEETASGLIDPSEASTRDGIDAAIHHVLATAACHSARRKGDRLDEREVRGLLEALDAEIWAPNCPHGRPIAVSLSDTELTRRFLRG